MGYGRIYKARFRDIAVTALQDFWELLAATGKPCLIHYLRLNQTSDLGDAAEEQLVFDIVRGVGSVTSGSGGSSNTPEPTNNNWAAAGATLERNNTTRLAAGSGSLETIETVGWNIRVPEPLIWTPETRDPILPGEYWSFGLPAAPADSLTVSSTLCFEELV